MTTAQEVLAKMTASSKVVDRLVKHHERVMMDLLRYGTAWVVGARVGAQRARKLRRRGEQVFFVHRTSTGKAVYTWMLSLIHI